MLAKRRSDAAGVCDDSGAEAAAGKGGRNTSPLFEASLLLTAVFLGTNPVAVKYAVGYIPPMPFVTLRFVLAGLVLWGILRLFDPKGRLRRNDLGAMAGLGLVGIALNNILVTTGVSMTTASNTALVVATAPLWGMLLAFVLGWERPKPKGIIGVCLALLGVGVIVYRGLGDSGASLQGDLLVMGAAACWGSYAVLSLRARCTAMADTVQVAYSMLFDVDPTHRGLVQCRLGQGGLADGRVDLADGFGIADLADDHPRVASAQAHITSQVSP